MCQIGLCEETSLTMSEIFNSVTACISCSRISFLQISCTFHIHIWNIFHIFQFFCCVYTYLLDTDAFCLLFFCPASALLHCFGTIDSCFSFYTSHNSTASWRRKACLLVFSRYTPVNDPGIYHHKIQYVIENMDRPPTSCCSCTVSVSHLVKNIDPTLCFVVELHSVGELFLICSNISCTMQLTQKQYILVDFSLIDCQGSTVTISYQGGFMKGGLSPMQELQVFLFVYDLSFQQCSYLLLWVSEQGLRM